MGAWPTSLALVPLATVVLMIGCNGRNHHSLLTALRYIPDDRIKYVAIVLLYHIYIFFLVTTSLLVASGHLLFSLLSFDP